MVVLIHNIIVSLTAILLILSGFNCLSKNISALYFIIVGLGDLFLSSKGINSLLYRIIVGAFILRIHQTKWSNALFYVTTAEIIIMASTFLVGPLIYLNPHISHMWIYNSAIALLVLIVSYFFKRLLQAKRPYIIAIPNSLKQYIVIIELMTAIPIALFYKYLNSKEQLLIATSLLFIYTVMVAILVTYTMKIVIQKNEFEIRKENAILQKELLIRNYGKSLHFITPAIATMRKFLDENDLDGLKLLYEKYIAPLNSRHIVDTQIQQLDLIKMELIYALLYELLARSEKIQLTIVGVININNEIISEVDLFVVLSEYINNALTHINQHQNGIIKIYICQNDVGTYIEIANNCFETNINKLYKVNHLDFGLKYTKEILDKHSIDYSTTIEAGWFIQRLEL